MRNATIGLGISLLMAAAPAGAERLFLAQAAHPSWSPDGRTIACVRPTPNWDDEHVQIWSAPMDGGVPDTLIVDAHGAYFPLWLPDGRLVYFRAYYDERQHYEFVVHDFATGSSQVWEVPGVWDDWGFALSPGGTEVLYTYQWAGEPNETRALDLDTGGVRTVVQGAGGVLSPDGAWIAFTDANDSLVVALAQGGTGRTLGSGAWPDWTADSRHIVYTGLENGTIDLFVENIDGTYRRRLTDDPEWNTDAAIAPSGDRVVFTKYAGEFAPPDLWILDLQFPPAPVQPVTWSWMKSLYLGATP